MISCGRVCTPGSCSTNSCFSPPALGQAKTPRCSSPTTNPWTSYPVQYLIQLIFSLRAGTTGGRRPAGHILRSWKRWRRQPCRSASRVQRPRAPVAGGGPWRGEPWCLCEHAAIRWPFAGPRRHGRHAPGAQAVRRGKIAFRLYCRCSLLFPVRSV